MTLLYTSCMTAYNLTIHLTAVQLADNLGMTIDKAYQCLIESNGDIEGAAEIHFKKVNTTQSGILRLDIVAQVSAATLSTFKLLPWLLPWPTPH